MAAATVALAAKGVTNGMAPGTTAVAAAPEMTAVEVAPETVPVAAAPGVAAALAPGVAAALAPSKTNSGAGAEWRCLFGGVISQEKRNGGRSDAAGAPVVAAPNKMTNRDARANNASAGARAKGVDVVVVIASVTFPSFKYAMMDFPNERDGGRNNANDLRAETRRVSVVVNVMESSNKRTAAADVADGRRRDDGVAITATFTFPSPSHATTTMKFLTEKQNPAQRNAR